MNRFKLHEPQPSRSIPSFVWEIDPKEQRPGCKSYICKRGSFWLKTHQYLDNGRWKYIPIVELRVGDKSLHNSYGILNSLTAARARTEEIYWQMRQDLMANL